MTESKINTIRDKVGRMEELEEKARNAFLDKVDFALCDNLNAEDRREYKKLHMEMVGFCPACGGDTVCECKPVYWIEIWERMEGEEDRLEKRIHGGTSEERAERIEDGVNINLNHDGFYTKLVKEE